MSAASAATASFQWRALAASRACAEGYFDSAKVADRFFVLTGEGGNSLVLVGADRSLLIDTKNSGFGGVLRRDAEAFGAPLKMVINTHHHFDHTGGNAAFTTDIEVLAHDAAKVRIGDQAQGYVRNLTQAIRTLNESKKPGAQEAAGEVEKLSHAATTAAQYQPTRTTRGNETITFADERIELVFVGSGHTDNDLIVFFPKSNVVHTGDLVFHKRHPYFDPPGGSNVKGWIKSVERIVSLCEDKTVLVPGHGPVGDVKAARAQIEYHTRVLEEAHKAVAAKRSREEFQKTEIEEFKGYEGERVKPIAFGAIFDEVMGGR